MDVKHHVYLLTQLILWGLLKTDGYIALVVDLFYVNGWKMENKKEKSMSVYLKYC